MDESAPAQAPADALQGARRCADEANATCAGRVHDLGVAAGGAGRVAHTGRGEQLLAVRVRDHRLGVERRNMSDFGAAWRRPLGLSGRAE